MRNGQCIRYSSRVHACNMSCIRNKHISSAWRTKSRVYLFARIDTRESIWDWISDRAIEWVMYPHATIGVAHEVGVVVPNHKVVDRVALGTPLPLDRLDH